MSDHRELRALELAFEELIVSERASLERIRELLVEAANAAELPEAEKSLRAFISFIDDLVAQRDKYDN